MDQGIRQDFELPGGTAQAMQGVVWQGLRGRMNIAGEPMSTSEKRKTARGLLRAKLWGGRGRPEGPQKAG